MPLIIGRREEESVDVAGVRKVTVLRIFGPKKYQIEITGDDAITRVEMVEPGVEVKIIPNVVLELGEDGAWWLAKLVFKAPRRINIIRTERGTAIPLPE